MKQKFETAVASDIPKTKLYEPDLPWKLSEDEMKKISSRADDLKAAASGMPPLKTRAPFLILLVVTVFGITTYLVTNMVVENEKMRSNIAKKEIELSLVQINLVRAVAEKNIVNKNSSQLKKKISNLTAQKRIFASIIESLIKKDEEIKTAQAAPILAITPASNAPTNAVQPSEQNAATAVSQTGSKQ